VRNEYEHPSLEFYSSENIQMWGNITKNKEGDIKAHAGKDSFVEIKAEHCQRIGQLRNIIFDLFIKHFSQKLLSEELIGLRDYLESSIDSLLEQLKNFRQSGDWGNFNDLLGKLTMYRIYLSREGIQLSDKTREKMYSGVY
jgi:hypothetical protein